ncbi:dCTP deaminase [Oscillospiraceae bacterium 50-16]
MILSDKEIRIYIQNTTTPMIEPFLEDHLQAASYDVSMSGNISVLRRIEQVVDPSEKRDLDDMYEEIRIGQDGYLFYPGEYLLAELAEKVNVPEKLIAHIRPRTRFTRAGILIADQHCNPTYEGQLYIGLRNVGPNTILLRPGLKIAQFVFEELSSVPTEALWYKNKKNAAYRQESSSKGFRGAKFGEAGWTEEGKKFFNDLLTASNDD